MIVVKATTLAAFSSLFGAQYFLHQQRFCTEEVNFFFTPLPGTENVYIISRADAFYFHVGTHFHTIRLHTSPATHFSPFSTKFKVWKD